MSGSQLSVQFVIDVALALLIIVVIRTFVVGFVREFCPAFMAAYRARRAERQ